MNSRLRRSTLRKGYAFPVKLSKEFSHPEAQPQDEKLRSECLIGKPKAYRNVLLQSRNKTCIIARLTLDSLQHKVIDNHALNLYRLSIQNRGCEAGAQSCLFRRRR